MSKNVVTVIQAGGRSRRMGRDKGLVRLGDRPLIEHVLGRVSGLTAGVWITTNRPEAYAYLGVPLAGDEIPGAGALFGLRTAFRTVSNEYVLLVGCDMPFLQPPLLVHLLSLTLEGDVVVPHWGGFDQPLCALYHRERCLAAVEVALAGGRRQMTSWYGAVHVRRVPPAEVARHDPQGRSFFNVNTPGDLANAREIFGEGPG